MRQNVLKQHSEFPWKDFQLRCNAELLGKYGNLVNRVLVFAANHCGSKAPARSSLRDIDLKLLKEIEELAAEIAHSYETFHLRRASQLMMQLAQTGNVYFDAKKPWSAAKNPETRQDMENTVSCCLECIKALALVSFPIIPETAEKVWSFLGSSSSLSKQNWDHVIKTSVPTGQILPKTEILFKKIEDDVIEEEIEKLKSLSPQNPKSPEAKQAPTAFQSLKPEVSFDD